MADAVYITFDCLPLRSVGRLDVPLDATDQQRARFERIKQAIADHGSFNSYYLTNAECRFQLTNSTEVGTLVFRFEGTVLTDPDDRQTRAVDVSVELTGESCDWLTRPAAEWFEETVRRAIAIEFDRYIAAGDLAQTLDRLERIQAQSDASGGFLGMYL